MNRVSSILQLLRSLVPGPGLFLLLIAPVTGAVLSGLTPPSHLFNLLTLFSLCVVYGGGAIICRELMLYWGKGWPTLLMLGAAFGVVDEGLLNKSFFDPHWLYLGSLASYGRWDGVNWVWAVQQTVFHAVFSVALPVLLVGLIFPKRRQQRWVGPRGLLILLVLFALALVLGFFFGSAYHPPLLLYGAALLVAIILIAIARFMPRTISLTRRTDAAPPLRFGILGLLGTATFFLINWLLPTTLAPFWIAIPLDLLVALVVGILLIVTSGNGAGWTDRQKVWLAGGALAFFIILAPFTEIFQRQRNPGGITFIALVTLGLLYLLMRRIERREKKAATTQGQAAQVI